MYLFQLWASLLPSVLCSSAEIYPAPFSQNGAAIVINDCNFTVYYKSISARDLPLSVLKAGEIYHETYQLNISPTGVLGGVSIKLASNQSIADAVDMSEAFDASTITQFEYTYDPYTAPGLWYDISNVDGYLNIARESWPFDIYGGLIVQDANGSCPTIKCPPNTRICTEAYKNWNDDWATRSCRNDNSLILTLCSTLRISKASNDTRASSHRSVAEVSLAISTNETTGHCTERM